MRYLSVQGFLKVLSRLSKRARDQAAAVPSRPMRIAFFGVFGVGNMGNEGSLDAVASALVSALPGAEFSCICSEPRVVAQRLSFPTHPILPSNRFEGSSRFLGRALRRAVTILKIFRHARTIDVLIVPGTGILDDCGESPRAMPLNLFFWCLAVRVAGARVAFLSVGAGPIHHPVSRWLMRNAARLANYRSWRDAISKDFMGGLGLNVSSDAVCPDVVFGMTRPPAPPVSDAGRGLCVGVGVMYYRGWYGFQPGAEEVFESYIEKIVLFIAYLLGSGHSVRLLVGDLKDVEAVRRVTEEIRRSIPQQDIDRVAWSPICSLHDLMGEMAQTDVVVATRFHNVVCALNMSRPVVSVGYASKNDVLMEKVGLGRFCQHIDSLDSDLLARHFEGVVANREFYAKGVARASAQFRENLICQEGRFVKWLHLGSVAQIA